jgi:signal transduction histidine kinase/DNA-binding response OmpR family regulator
MVTPDSAPAPLILVADDEEPTRLMLGIMLKRAGYRIETVSDGVAALDAARDLAPDLLLLDILMPGMNGFEVLRRLREQPDTASLPTILVTANARRPSDVAKGLQLGADDYIQKPFETLELLARIESKLRSSRLERTLHQRTNELERLLNVSETLNAHLTELELLDVILDLIQQIAPGPASAILRLDDDGQVTDTRSVGLPAGALDRFIHARPIAEVIPFHSDITLTWSIGDSSPIAGLPSGMIAPMAYRGSPVGLLMVGGQTEPYRPQQQRMLEGLARQAALALVNAQLYDMLSDYAQNLETMVEARTNELQSTQRLLLRSEKLSSIGRLAASIAHEINNPLMPIMNLIESIVEDLDAQHVEYDHQAVEMIQDSLERIRVIVSRILEFSRDQKPGMDYVDVSRVLDTVIALNRKSFEHSRMQITTDIQPMPTVFASPDQLQQVFMNIVLNAQAAMQPGGRLVIRTRALEESVLVEFQDTGCGIAPENVDRVFEPFYSTKPSGTGLGLFVSHSIVQAHQGAIELITKEGHGTTFTVRLPRTNEPARV